METANVHAYKYTNNEHWVYNGTRLEVVNDFKYLGVVFNYTGSFVLNQQALCGKGLKPMNILISNINKYEVRPKTALQLFDAFVSSILNYSSEIWGFCKGKNMEALHLRFCKYVLGVKITTSNAGVYGELGRYPLFVNRFIHILKYWFKILQTDNFIIRHYASALADCNRGKTNWVTKVKT